MLWPEAGGGGTALAAFCDSDPGSIVYSFLMSAGGSEAATCSVSFTLCFPTYCRSNKNSWKVVVTVPVGCTIREAVETARRGDYWEVTGVWEEAARPFYTTRVNTVPRAADRLRLGDRMPGSLVVLEEREVRAKWWKLCETEAALEERKHWEYLNLYEWSCCSYSRNRDGWMSQAFLDAELKAGEGPGSHVVPSKCVHRKCSRPVDSSIPWYNLCTGCAEFGGWVKKCEACGGGADHVIHDSLTGLSSGAEPYGPRGGDDFERGRLLSWGSPGDLGWSSAGSTNRGGWGSADRGTWGGAGWPAGLEGGGWSSACSATRSQPRARTAFGPRTADDLDGWGQPRDRSWGGAGWSDGNGGEPSRNSWLGTKVASSKHAVPKLLE